MVDHAILCLSATFNRAIGVTVTTGCMREQEYMHALCRLACTIARVVLLSILTVRTTAQAAIWQGCAQAEDRIDRHVKHLGELELELEFNVLERLMHLQRCWPCSKIARLPTG